MDDRGGAETMTWRDRQCDFCRSFGITVPVLLAPMAGACPPPLSVAVANAGGMGACGALPMGREEIVAWASEFRAASPGSFQMNLWVPDPEPARDGRREEAMRKFLAGWGPRVPPEAGDARPLDFAGQCEALIDSGAPVASSVMGLFPPLFVGRLKARRIRWFATVSTVREAIAAEAAGADAIVVQGMEAGGHRAAFMADRAQMDLVGLFSLLPAVVDNVGVPVVAAGGIADGRGIAAAFALGASAVQIGTGFLRCPEAGIPVAWAEALRRTLPEDTTLTRAFSGRLGRSVATGYVRAAEAGTAPQPAPYPVQRGLTAPMRRQAAAAGDLDGMQAWAGQSASLSSDDRAAALLSRLWSEAQALLA